jgi:hypothetical protein
MSLDAVKVCGSPEELEAFTKSKIDRWKKVTREAWLTGVGCDRKG